MDLALITMGKIIEMFVILVVGFLAFKVNILDNESNKRLSAMLTKIISPALLFMSYQLEFDKKRMEGLIVTLLLAILTHVVSIVVSNLAIRRGTSKDVEIERFSCVYSNCGFIGIPLIQAIYGQEGVFYMTAYITIFNLFVWSHGLTLMCGKASSFLATVKKCVQPVTVMIVLGIICFLFGIKIPEVIGNPLKTIGAMNTPVAMIVAGCNLAESDLMGTLKRMRSYYISFIKLILIPVICTVIMKFIPMDPIYITSVLIGVACPAGAMGTVLALQYDKNSNYASELFTLTTLLSLFTIPLSIMIMGMLIS